MKRVEVTHIPAKRSKKTSEETYYAKTICGLANHRDIRTKAN
jgi:hypothetical protein